MAGTPGRGAVHVVENVPALGGRSVTVVNGVRVSRYLRIIVASEHCLILVVLNSNPILHNILPVPISRRHPCGGGSPPPPSFASGYTSHSVHLAPLNPLSVCLFVNPFIRQSVIPAKSPLFTLWARESV